MFDRMGPATANRAYSYTHVVYCFLCPNSFHTNMLGSVAILAQEEDLEEELQALAEVKEEDAEAEEKTEVKEEELEEELEALAEVTEEDEVEEELDEELRDQDLFLEGRSHNKHIHHNTNTNGTNTTNINTNTNNNHSANTS